MRVLDSLSGATHGGGYVTLGFFDGVHAGHRALLEEVCDAAHTVRKDAIALTLWPHPHMVLPHAQTAIELITDLDRKLELMRDTGLDAVVVLPFTRELAAMDAEAFLAMVCHSPLQPSCLYVGYDHRFGRGGKGDYQTLTRYASQHGLLARRGGVVRVDGSDVSSTRIRKAISQGRMELASRLLGKPFAFTGHVEGGQRVGRTLGFPTANIRPRGEWQLLPGRGVYQGQCALANGCAFPAVINVGTRPTIAESEQIRVEAHLIGYQGNLYGEEITATFHRKLRDEERFNSLEALSAQIHLDVARVIARIDPGDSTQ